MGRFDPVFDAFATCLRLSNRLGVWAIACRLSDLSFGRFAVWAICRLSDLPFERLTVWRLRAGDCRGEF